MSSNTAAFAALPKSLKNCFRPDTVSGILLILVVYIVCVSIYKPNFFTLQNWMNILRTISFVGIMSNTLTFNMLTGNIDLSCGSVLALAGCISCSLIDKSPLLAVLVPIFTGGVCGLVNGILVGVIKLNAFVATLGMLSVYQALAFFYTGSEYLTSSSQSWYRAIGQGSTFGVPNPAIIFLIVVLVCLFVQRKTVFGAQLYAVGSNPVSARFSGISPSWMIVKAYVIGGLGVGLSSVLLVSRSMSSQPKMGEGYEFQVLTAVVVGGLSMAGGKGSAWGTLIGVLFVGVISTGLTVMGLNHNIQSLALGAILIIAVVVNRLVERRERE